MFSKVAGASVFKTRYGLTAFIVVDFWKNFNYLHAGNVKFFQTTILYLACFLGVANLF